MTNAPTLPNFATPIRHPARYSDALLPVMAQYLKPGMRVLDPFGGVGTIHRLGYTGAKFYTGEIEYRVCEHSAGTRRTCADAQMLPFASESFDAIVTSPTYGNRMGDETLMQASSQKLYINVPQKDKWKRNTYDSQFGFSLHPSNTGGMNWDEEYRAVHKFAYLEAFRVVKPRGLMVCNISDHIRDFKRVYVSKWHFDTLRAVGFEYVACHFVRTPRLRFGANSELRTAGEYIFVFQRP